MPAKRIMIVEDEPSAAAALEIELGEHGYGICPLVCSSEAAIAQAEAEKPDLVIMDIGIYGRMGGIEAAHVIRQRFNIPVILITGDHDAETLRKAGEGNPDGYLLKPIRIDELLEIIERRTAVTSQEFLEELFTWQQ